jgi:hypothetical protein
VSFFVLFSFTFFTSFPSGILSFILQACHAWPGVAIADAYSFP